MKQGRLLSVMMVVTAAVFVASTGYAGHGQYYVLDGFGGVHAGGGAPTPPAGIPYFGFDIAKGIAYVPDTNGDGLIVLDGFGGIHTAGLSIGVTATPYFGFDVARDIVYRNVPVRAANGSDTSTIDISSTAGGFTVLSTTSINAPDDGFLLVIGTTFLSCLTPGNDLSAQVQVNVDSTGESISNMGRATWDDCASGGGIQNTSNQTVHHLFPVSAGGHTVNLLGRKTGGTGTARFLGRSLTAVFIDQGPTGQSAPQTDPNAANAAVAR